MHSRLTRIPAWAWLISTALHALAASLLYLLLPGEAPRFDAVRANTPNEERFGFALETPDDEPTPQLLVPLEPTQPQLAAQPAPATPSEPVSRPPTLTTFPSAISRDFQETLRTIASRPSPGPVAVEDELPLPPTASELQQVQNIEASKRVSSPPAVVPPPRMKLEGGKPIHAELPKEVTAVYLLDGSASMGLNRDTFDAARRALLATVRGLAPGSKFQVLIYQGTVRNADGERPGKMLTANEDTFRQLADSLAEYHPEGKSGHEVGLKAAVQSGADYIIWITDANEDEVAQLKRLLKIAAKPVAVYLARATSGTVAAPIEVRQ